MRKPTGRQPQTETANQLLKSLPAPVLGQIWPRLYRIALPNKAVLVPAAGIMTHAYFPESGVVSLICVLLDGVRIEVGMAGFDGMVGHSLLFGSDRSQREALVQVEGKALQMTAKDFLEAVAEFPEFAAVIMKYAEIPLLQATQSAACNARHTVKERLARWLLATHDRVSSDSFTMTQETMSTLVGIRRPGVSLALGALQKTGVVKHVKGQMHILDRRGLEAAACECHAVVKRQSAKLFKSHRSSR